MNPSLRMYEIRWSEVQAIPVDPVSGAFGQRVENIQVRLYYVERGDAWVVGLLAHEKDVSLSVQDDIDALQDEMIRQAGAIAIAEEADAWGVPELGCRISPA